MPALLPCKARQGSPISPMGLTCTVSLLSRGGGGSAQATSVSRVQGPAAPIEPQAQHHLGGRDALVIDVVGQSRLDVQASLQEEAEGEGAMSSFSKGYVIRAGRPPPGSPSSPQQAGAAGWCSWRLIFSKKPSVKTLRPPPQEGKPLIPCQLSSL